PVLTLVQGKSYEDRVGALAALGKLGDAAAPAIPALLVFMQQAQGADKLTAVNTLAAVGNKDPQLAASFATIALKDTDPAVRAAALKAMAKQQNPASGMEVINKALTTDNDPKQRIGAITALTDIGKGNAEAIKMLEAAMKSDQSPEVKAAAKQALDKLKKK